MDTLSDYFRLKEYDRLEAEKKCMVALKKVIDICIKKEINFSVNLVVNSIYVSFDTYEFSLDSYFKGELINYSSGSTKTIFELLKYLNDFKKQ